MKFYLKTKKIEDSFETIFEEENKEWILQEAAKTIYYKHKGWELNWPITTTIHKNGHAGAKLGRFTLPKPAFTSMMGVGYVCGFCGHEDHAHLFAETPVSGQLPLGVSQCPRCMKAWRKRRPSEQVSGVFSGETLTWYPDHPDAVEGTDNRLLCVDSVF